MISGFDHIQIVFDDQYRIAGPYQLLQHLDELVNICGMQTGGGFIQHVNGTPGG